MLVLVERRQVTFVRFHGKEAYNFYYFKSQEYMKKNVFLDIASYSIVDIDRRFRGAKTSPGIFGYSS
jgi:hypothetical protein